MPWSTAAPLVAALSIGASSTEFSFGADAAGAGLAAFFLAAGAGVGFRVGRGAGFAVAVAFVLLALALVGRPFATALRFFSFVACATFFFGALLSAGPGPGIG